MVLYSTDSYLLVLTDATPSLPDPVLFPSRTHELVNAGSVTAVWSSTGTTPFLVDGVAVSTLSVPRGTSVQVQSNGTHWVVFRPAGTRRVFASTAVTAANGQASFVFTPPFSSVPVVTATVVGDGGANGAFAEILSLSASSVTVQAWTGQGVLIGGQTTDQVGAGITVHVHATVTGQG